MVRDNRAIGIQPSDKFRLLESYDHPNQAKNADMALMMAKKVMYRVIRPAVRLGKSICVGALAHTHQTTNDVNKWRYTGKSDSDCAQKTHAETRESSCSGVGSQQQSSRYSR